MTAEPTRWAFNLFVLAFLTVPVLAFANSGSVFAVTQPAQVVQNGETRRLIVGDIVRTGDTVLTGETGQIQLLFPDETKIVVGPRSQLKIHRLLFKNETTAKRFHVRAVAGTFRILTGNSPKRAYSVRTPTASMAVRGTQFDFSVARRMRITTLAVLGGKVNLCAVNSRCVLVASGCQMASLNQTQEFSQPRTLADRNDILENLFPFTLNEDALAPAFRADENACADGKNRSSAVPAAQILLPKLTLPPPPEKKEKSRKAAEPGRDNPAE